MNGRNIPHPGGNQKPGSNSTQARSSHVIQRNAATCTVGQTPIAPPVYRPQPIPRVLQRKSVTPQSSGPDKSIRARIAPAKLQVEAKGIVLRKTLNVPKAPPVFNPNPTPRVLQLKTAVARGVAAPHRITAVIQRADGGGGRSSSNVNVYTSLGKSYTPEQLEAAQEEALGQNIHGHRSGGGGSGVSQQTETDVAKVVAVLHKHKAAAHKAKKAVSRDKPPASDFFKAHQMAESIFAEKGSEGLGDFLEYVERRELEISDAEMEKLMAIFTS